MRFTHPLTVCLRLCRERESAPQLMSYAATTVSDLGTEDRPQRPRTGPTASAPSHRWVVGAILALAAFIRYWELASGLPALYVHDEIIEVHRALSLVRGDLATDFVSLPGNKGFFFLILAFEYWVVGALNVLAGESSSMAAYVSSAMAEPGQAVFIGRATAAAFGIASVFLMYAISRKLFADPALALITAMVWAVAPMPAWIAHWLLVETPLVTLGLWSFYRALVMLERPTATNYLFAAVLAACAAACKVYGAGLVLILGVLHHCISRREGRPWWNTCLDRRIVTAAAAFLCVWAMLSPLLLLQIAAALGFRESLTRFTPASDFPLETHLGYYLTILRWNVGNLILPFVGVGLWAAIRRRCAPVLAIAVFTATFVGIMGLWRTNTLVYARYMLLPLPFVCLIAVYGLEVIVDALSRLTASRWAAVGRFVTTLVFLYAAVGNGFESLLESPLYRRLPTPVQQLAMTWFEREVEPGTKVLIRGEQVWPGHQTLPLRDLRENYLERYRQLEATRPPVRYRAVLQDLAGQPYAPRYDLTVVDRTADWDSPEHYLAGGIEYVVMDKRFSQNLSRQAAVSRLEFYDTLASSAHFSLVKTFHGPDLQGTPKTIEVYRANRGER